VNSRNRFVSLFQLFAQIGRANQPAVTPIATSNAHDFDERTMKYEVNTSGLLLQMMSHYQIISIFIQEEVNNGW
jgi:hypothetical protein|tara:strand:+ start:351 stop:572 length:222 start_codon:yes stop_codon:yes gene_type:complete